MAQEMDEEQMKALQEKIKNMSPEELKEFQKKQCVFCQIISGKVQARKIYDDERVFGILDINPANPGHVLLLTKEHYSIMPQVPDDELSHISMVAKSLSNAMLRSIDAQGTNVVIANGVAAGQRAQHFMMHIIPRKENDGINFTLPQKAMEQKDIESIGDKLASAINGKPPKEKEAIQIPAIPVKSEPAQKKEEKKPKEEKPREPEKKEDGSSIDLDDISRLLGVK